MANWSPPFPFDIRRIRPEDERYSREHGAAPKAFVSLAAGRRLWSSRFGQSTSIFAGRLPKPLALDPAAMGFVFQPLKRQALAAASGSTPFDVLFLAFSSFLIVAAVMLAALLLRLAVERRAAEIGILLAVGFSRRQVAPTAGRRGFCSRAPAGACWASPAGVGYAAILLTGLNTWWRAAVTTPFLHLYATPRSLAIGFGVSTAAAMLAIFVTARRITRVSPRRLLAGETSEESSYLAGVASGRSWRRGDSLRALVLLAFGPAVAMAIAPIRQDVQVGAFFAAGAISLVSLLALAGLRFRAGAIGSAVAVGRGNLVRLALRNAARRPGRSTLTMGLVASASFLIVSVSAFRLDPSQQGLGLHGASGGFSLVAQSDQPIYQDLNSPAGTRRTRVLARRRATAGRVQDRFAPRPRRRRRQLPEPLSAATAAIARRAAATGPA